MRIFRTYSYRLYPGKDEASSIEALLDSADDAFDELANAVNELRTRGEDEAFVQSVAENYGFSANIDVFAAKGVRKLILRLLASPAVGHIYPRNRNRGRRRVNTAVPSISNGQIEVPGAGPVCIVMHRPLPQSARVFGAALVSDCGGAEYYIQYSLYYDVLQPAERSNIAADRVLGIDYAQNGLYVDSEGNSGGYPGYGKAALEETLRLKAALARCIVGSGRWKKFNRRLKKLEKHVRNERDDWQNKRAKCLSESYDAICHESLDFKAMIDADPRLAAKIYDNDWRDFRRRLKDRMSAQGKPLLEAPKYYPSSQICSSCGFRTGKLGPEIRVFVCPSCGLVIDRDVNSAMNLKNTGIRLLAA